MMAAWSIPADVFQPVRDARAAWERTQPQLFLETDVLSEPGDYRPPDRPLPVSRLAEHYHPHPQGGEHDRPR